MSQGRWAIGALTLSAAALVSLALHEGYREEAYLPLPNDRVTIGFGSTEGVKLGDRTTPPKALERALKDVQKYEGALRQCVKVPLSQQEFDAYISFAYNVGETAFCSSTLVKKLNAGDYLGACMEITRWTWAAGKDCRIKANKCYGLVERRENESKKCQGI